MHGYCRGGVTKVGGVKLEVAGLLCTAFLWYHFTLDGDLMLKS